jgi:hypothetical protein
LSDENPETTAPAAAPKPQSSTPKPPPNVLSRPTDAAVRPGFRSPPNKGSKAQKAQKSKKK